MSFHIYHSEPCPACGYYYIRFATTERCPRCESGAAPLYELVDEVVQYARTTLFAAGHLALDGYRVITPADHYLILAYDLLDAFRHHPELDPALVAAEAIRHYQRGLGTDESVLAHWQRFFEAVLRAWQAERNKPL